MKSLKYECLDCGLIFDPYDYEDEDICPGCESEDIEEISDFQDEDE